MKLMNQKNIGPYKSCHIKVFSEKIKLEFTENGKEIIKAIRISLKIFFGERHIKAQIFHATLEKVFFIAIVNENPVQQNKLIFFTIFK